MRMAQTGGELDLTPIQLTGGPRSNAGQAADNVSLGKNFAALEKRKPRYDQMAADWIEDRAQEENAATAAKAEMYAQGLQSNADIVSSRIAADAAKDAADTEASASKTASTIGGIATVVSAGIGLLSDESTKHTVDRIDNACETLRNLVPVTFFYKEEYSSSPERMHHGFIAQEFQKVMPDATYYDETIGKLCIDTGELIALLVRANQQLESRITRIEAANALVGVKS